MKRVQGTNGYDRAIDRFVRVSQSLSFEQVCSDIIPFLPASGSTVLDVGAGAGQNAAALSRMGYSVLAIEPMGAFLEAARTKYQDLPITWLQDALPTLDAVPPEAGPADLILVEAVWHHLEPPERYRSLSRIVSLLVPRGVCILSLRNGPAGLGSHVFPTDTTETIRQAEGVGLECIFQQSDLPSSLPNKELVKWARLVLRKIS